MDNDAEGSGDETRGSQRIYEQGLAAFDDGMVLAYGSLGNAQGQPLAYRIGSDLRFTEVPGVPPTLERLDVAGDTLYAKNGDEVLTSTDRGAHWTRVQLR